MIQFIDKYIVSYDEPIKVVKVMLYLKLLQEDIRLTDNDLSVLSLFVYHEDIKEVAKEAIKKEFKNSIRSVENTVSDLVEKGILLKTGIGKRQIKTEYIPEIKTNVIAVNCKIHNVKST